MPLVDLGLYLRDSAMMLGKQGTPLIPTGMGVYTVKIPLDSRLTLEDSTDPVFIMAARVPDSYTGNDDLERRVFDYVVRVIEAPMGKIDLDDGKLEMRFQIRFPLLGSGDFKAFIDLRGDIQGYGRNKPLDPSTDGGGFGTAPRRPGPPIVLRFP